MIVVRLVDRKGKGLGRCLRSTIEIEMGVVVTFLQGHW